MKKFILLFNLMLAYTLTSAQELKTTENGSSTPNKKELKNGNHKQQPNPEARANKYLAKMTEVLSLKEEQKSKIKSLALDHYTRMEAIRKNTQGDKEKIKAEIEKSRKELSEGLKKVLSPDQLTKWKEAKKEKKHQKNGSQKDIEE